MLPFPRVLPSPQTSAWQLQSESAIEAPDHFTPPFFPIAAYASPFDTGITSIQTLFTSTIARAASLIAIVIGGYSFAHIAQQLAHIGLGNFLVIDPDFIEDTNLNRLVGATMEDVKLGTAKVDIAERVIKAVNPAAEVVKHLVNWTEVTTELRDVDVIFACVDSISCRNELETFARRFLIPLIDIGMDVHKSSGEFSIGGQVMLSMPGKPCMRCMGLVTDDALAKEAARFGAAGGKPQVVWPNGTLASIAVGFFMKLVTPWETHKATPLLLEYDGDLQMECPANFVPVKNVRNWHERN
jgi:molybdopterin-synthase adenylyltransferase